MSGDRAYILDDSGVLPCLELEVVALRVALVTHLGHYAVFLFSLHHELALIEGMSHRLLHVYIDSQRHGKHADREVAVVRSTDADSIDLVSHFSEHLAEILITWNVRMPLKGLLSMFRTHVDVAQCNDFAKFGSLELLDDLTASESDSHARESHFLAGLDLAWSNFLLTCRA